MRTKKELGWALVLSLAVACRAPAPSTRTEQIVPQSAPQAADAASPAAGTGAPTRIGLRRFAAGAAPLYPELSVRLGEEGVVELRIDLRNDGSVARLEVARSSGHARLDQAALAAARTWSFTPRTGESAVESLRHRVVFRLLEAR